MEVVIPNLPRAASLVNAVPFRLPPARLQQQLQQFNARGEILWFGFGSRGWKRVRRAAAAPRPSTAA
jgi:hypothetical protein